MAWSNGFFDNFHDGERKGRGLESEIRERLAMVCTAAQRSLPCRNRQGLAAEFDQLLKEISMKTMAGQQGSSNDVSLRERLAPALEL